MSFVIGDLEYHDHICIRWKVQFPLHYPFLMSRSVCFRQSELALRLILSTGPPLLIMLMKSNSALDGFYVTETFLLDKNKAKFQPKAKSMTFTEPFYSELWSIDRNLLYNDLDTLVPNGVLNFVCIVNFSQHCCQEIGSTLDVSQPTDSSLEKLSLDVSKLYKSSELSDVTLKCGDKTIPSHKFLLCARSDVFAAMFRNDVIERREGVVDLQDIEVPILDHLLKYMYSGKTYQVSADTALQLYRAADKYAVCSLRNKCASVLIKNLTEDNACDILVLADSHSDVDLKKNVISFLLKKDGFLLSDQWRAFSQTHAGLAVEAYDAFLRHMSHT